MRSENLCEIRTFRAERIFAELRLPLSPEDCGEHERKSLGKENTPHRPRRRSYGMIPEERDRSDERERDGGEYPIGELSPMCLLHFMEISADQLPRAKDIAFHRPYCAYVVKAESEIEDKKYEWGHA